MDFPFQTAPDLLHLDFEIIKETHSQIGTRRREQPDAAESFGGPSSNQFNLIDLNQSKALGADASLKISILGAEASQR
jgi:hypothetical protein